MEELSSLIKHRDLVLVPIDTDRYGRTVVFVWSGSTCVNKEMVRRGAAWFYDEFSQSNVLHLIEDNARDAKRGLWRLPLNQRTEPWVWRQEKR
jgi:endonuclease YncB( thermonuclease family)